MLSPITDDFTYYLRGLPHKLLTCVHMSSANEQFTFPLGLQLWLRSTMLETHIKVLIWTAGIYKLAAQLRRLPKEAWRPEGAVTPRISIWALYYRAYTCFMPILCPISYRLSHGEKY
jgi:hypothetical protein